MELLVVDDHGGFAFAHGQVAVSDGTGAPPAIYASAIPSRGTAPVNVKLQAEAYDADGTVELIQWDFGGGFVMTGSEQQHLFSQAGLYQVRVRARDDSGMTAEQILHIAVSDHGNYPPKIISEPLLQAPVSEPWTYSPKVLGTAPLSWSLGKQAGDQLLGSPEAMKINSQTGELAWTPSEGQIGAVEVTLVVKNLAGSDFQDFQVQVTGTAGQSGCGCSVENQAEVDAKLLWLLLAMLLLARSRSR